MTISRRIYVASSWRNEQQQSVVASLREAGHEVYDFKNPAGKTGISWSQCGVGDCSTIDGYLAAVQTERAKDGFTSDKQALDWCDTCVIVLPCGRSAHLEAGYTAGQGKDTYFLLHPDKFEPELMYLLGDGCVQSVPELLSVLSAAPPADARTWHRVNGGRPGRLANHAIRLLREIVELCIASGAQWREIHWSVDAEVNKARARGDFLRPGDIPQELADCRILLDVLAEHAGADTRSTIRHKIGVLWGRKWAPDGGGALYRPGSL